MRPPWPRLALRSLVRGGPVWPYFRLRWPRQEWPGVAKLLIQLHSVAFGCIAYPPNPHPPPSPGGRRDLPSKPGMRGSPAFTGTTEGTGPTRRWRSHPRRGTVLRSAQERQTFNSVSFGCISSHSLSSTRGLGMRGSRLRGNDGGICGNDACDQCKGWRGGGAMGSCRWFGVGGGGSTATATRCALSGLAATMLPDPSAR